jgi:hypothetical protein
MRRSEPAYDGIAGSGACRSWTADNLTEGELQLAPFTPGDSRRA